MTSILRITEYKFCKKSLKFYFIGKDTIPREAKAIFQGKATFWKENQGTISGVLSQGPRILLPHCIGYY